MESQTRKFSTVVIIPRRNSHKLFIPISITKRLFCTLNTIVLVAQILNMQLSITYRIVKGTRYSYTAPNVSPQYLLPAINRLNYNQVQ